MRGSKYARFWEVDFIRGLAIIGMVLTHIILDLERVGNMDVGIDSPYYDLFLDMGRMIFVFLCGISLSLSYSRWRALNWTDKKIINALLRRGAQLFFLGILITLLSAIFFPHYIIYFGILHLIGLSVIFSYPFLKNLKLNLFAAPLSIILGFWLHTIHVPFYYLFWIGLTPEGYQSVDFLPLFPAFGVVLLGAYLGRVLYPDYSRRFKIKDMTDITMVRWISKAGRHTLFIYLLHQPVLLALIFLFLMLI
ncbi:MAG: heparan-alpha-glucosaminide N-acetyltransferase [Thermoplasmatota archaeon]